MVVSRQQFKSTVELLTSKPKLAVDTETTGLKAYQGDKLFSVIFADESNEYYFDFNDYTAGEHLLPREWISKLQPIFSAPGLLIGHNLKFDLHMLANEGIETSRELWCTEAQARLEYNVHLKYSLDSCAERIGLKKDDAVKAWMVANGAFEWVTFPGKKKREKNYHYWKVPLDVIVPYGCKDARIAFQLYQYQINRFDEIDAPGIGAPSIWNVVKNEQAITRSFFRAERAGIRVDLGYCKQALEFELERAHEAARTFKELSGTELVDSAPALRGPLFAAGVACGKTEKGGDSYAGPVLEAQKQHPLVLALLDYRDAQKRAGTYWSSFIASAGRDGRIHANLRQAGTKTGRTSCADPNLQNLTSEDEIPEEDLSLYPVRRAFIPAGDEVLVSIDYTQMEYYLMLDYAGEMGVIDQVLKGVDLHQATADMMGVTRKEAKTINFGLLYGSGADKLAQMLGCSPMRAKELKRLYFEKLPAVSRFVRTVSKTAERRGYIFNWMGRRCAFPDASFAYKAPNYLIQGGCADIKKLAVVWIDNFLMNRESRLLMEIHDEALLGVKRKELHIIPEIVGLMERAYTPKLLPMKCSVAWSDKSWHDLVEGVPA